MNPVRIAAVATVTAALVLYGVGTFRERRAGRATAGVRGFLSAGLACDVLATLLMIVATGGLSLTLHGLLGYSALALMTVDVVLLRGHWRAHGDAPLPAGKRRYATLAYAYWVFAYVAGAALVASRHAASR